MRLNISTPIQNPPNATSPPRSSHQDHYHHSQHPRTPPSPLLIRSLLYLRCLFIGDQISLTVFYEATTVKHHRQSPIVHDTTAYRTTTSLTNTSSEAQMSTMNNKTTCDNVSGMIEFSCFFAEYKTIFVVNLLLLCGT
ncbi:hypothetical protein LXL04_018021 [Taraxacum kok-saghyz]